MRRWRGGGGEGEVIRKEEEVGVGGVMRGG